MDDRTTSHGPGDGPDEPGDSGRNPQPRGDCARPERILHWRDMRTGRFMDPPDRDRNQARMFT